MKVFLTILFLAVLPLSGAPVTVLQLKALLLEKLDAHQGKADGLYTVSNRELRVGPHLVELTPVVESDGSARGKSILSMRLEVSVDGVRQPAATFGAVGIGATADEAVAVGLGEWYLGFGQPFFRAMAGRKPDLATADFDVFAGALGLRGSAAVGWLDGTEAMNRRILGALTPTLGGLRDFVILDLKVMVPPSGQPQSECRLNGSISAEVAGRLVTLDWPRTENGYLFKQAFVLTRKKIAVLTLPADRLSPGQEVARANDPG